MRTKPDFFSSALQKGAELEQEDVLLYANFGNSSQDKNKLLWGEKTQQADFMVSGQWRTNILLESHENDGHFQRLSLRHLTSFEQKSMEDHGKRLSDALNHYLESINRELTIQNKAIEEAGFRYLHWQQVEQALASSCQLQSCQKNYLISFCKRNIEGQLILRQMFNLIAPCYLRQSLVIVCKLFEDYQDSNIVLLEQDEIPAHASQNCVQKTQAVKKQLEGSDILPTTSISDFEFSQLVRSWTQTIYLGLNGVYENPQDRQGLLPGLQGLQTFYTSRKLVKID